MIKVICILFAVGVSHWLLVFCRKEWRHFSAFSLPFCSSKDQTCLSNWVIKQNKQYHKL